MNVILNQVFVDPVFYEQNLEGIKASPAYAIFGDSMMVKTYEDWLNFLIAGESRVREFMGKYHLQYHLPSSWALMSNTKNCIERSIGTNDPRYLVASAAYAGGTVALMGMLQALRDTEQPFEPLHPSFTPSEEDFGWFMAYMSVLAETSKFLWVAVQVAYQRMNEQAQAANEA